MLLLIPFKSSPDTGRILYVSELYALLLLEMSDRIIVQSLLYSEAK